MRIVRFKEQKKAAVVGEYGAQVLLDYKSTVVKDPQDKRPCKDLLSILHSDEAQVRLHPQPGGQTRYPRGDTLRVVEAIRCHAPRIDHKNCMGAKSGEAWIGWWMSEKYPSTSASMRTYKQHYLGVFDSQICGGNATTSPPWVAERPTPPILNPMDWIRPKGLSFGMDLTPLILTINSLKIDDVH